MKRQRQAEGQQQVVQLSNPEEATNNGEIVKLLSINPAGVYHVDGLVHVGHWGISCMGKNFRLYYNGMAPGL